MTPDSLVRVLLVRWHVTVAGVLLTLVAAAVAYSLVPVHYVSSGTAVLLQPKQLRSSTANPLLTFDSSLNTTALIVVQALSAPQVATDLGLTERDRVSVRNGASGAVRDDGIQQPFISVRAESPTARRSTEIVSWVMARGQRDLAARQDALKVATRNQVRLQDVVVAETPVVDRDSQFRVVGVVILAGLLLTVLWARAHDRAGRHRRLWAEPGGRVVTNGYEVPDEDPRRPVNPTGVR